MKKLLWMMGCVLFLCHCTVKPDSLHDSEGNILPLRDFQGKWVIVNFWAQWCDACLHELPQLNAFYRRQQGGSVRMMGATFDRLSADALRLAVKKMHFAFPVVREDPGLFWSLPKTTVLPVTFIVGPDGQLRKTLIGPQTVRSLSEVLHQLQSGDL